MSKTKVTVLDHGCLQTDRSWITFGPPYMSPAIATRNARETRSPLCRIPVQTFIVEHPEGLILFDCGIRSDWATAWPDAYQEIAWYDDTEPEVYFETALKSAGYGPEDFRYVFVSHLHADHAGGLSLFQRADVPVLVHEDELKGALSLQSDEEFYVRGDYDLPGLNWTPLYGDREIMCGVAAIEVPGHTWGTMALRVDTLNGTLILSSDACLDLEAYGPPAISSLSNMDHERYIASVDKLRRRAHADNARLVFGHDRCCAAHSNGQATAEALVYWPNGRY